MTVNNMINPIADYLYVPNSPRTAPDPNTSSFDTILNAALGVINETNQYQITAETAQIDFATGKDDNILTVLLAQEKAYSTLNFTVQVTNKIIEAYREIMRMQI